MLQTYTGKKSLRSRDSTPFVTVLVSDRTRRTIRYASACPRVCSVASDALLRVFPRRRYEALG